nr:MAG TPA: hypothetical protein [Caudoviricetes sp.]
MKLKELLEVIPDDCEIGLILWDNGFSVSYGTKYEAIEQVAYRYKLIREQVKNMDVKHVYSGVNVKANNVERLARVTYPLDVIPELIIEIE